MFYLSTISEGANQLDDDLFVIEELVVNVNNTINRVRSCDMVNIVSTAQVQGYLHLGGINNYRKDYEDHMPLKLILLGKRTMNTMCPSVYFTK